jgi:carboxymethylenebutenolidase
MQEKAIREEILSLTGAKPSWSRRDFVAAAAGGFALAVQPVCAQTTILTDPRGLAIADIKIPTYDGSIPGYASFPASGSRFPVVLVVQEIFGLHEHIKDVCRRLAKNGYMAVAPDLYVRQGNVMEMKDNKEILSEVVAKVPDAQVMSDLDAAVAWAGRYDGDTSRLGITGFCWGGRIVWLYAAHNPALDAGVAWYGPLDRTYHGLSPLTPISVAGRIRAPVLGLYGAADAGISNDSVKQMAAALKAAGNTQSEIILYPDTPHAFHADYRPTYRKQQAMDGWDRLLGWFKRYL